MELAGVQKRPKMLPRAAVKQKKKVNLNGSIVEKIISR